MRTDKKQSSYLILFAMFYTAVGVASLSLPYKLVGIGPYVTSGASVIMPFWYAIGDLIAEVYGFKIAQKMIWFSVLSCTVYAIMVSVMISTPSPVGWEQQSAFNYVFGSLFRATMGGNLSVIIGGILNAYLITKWKFLLKGRYFWLRSLGSSAVGESLQLIVACSIMYAFKMTPLQIMHIIISVLTIHFCVTLVIVFPNNILVNILKAKEARNEINNVGLKDYNPFNSDVL